MTPIPSLSIIVPTRNEVGNVAALVNRIQRALQWKARYEIIFIDDHSTDGTVGVIKQLIRSYPGIIRGSTKKGKTGKAYSLIEGFALARYELVCMIDADLQYPPEATPAMLRKLAEGSDVVVASRVTHDTGFVRRVLSKLGRSLYGKWLHHFDVDVQSGMKLFRKDILERIELNGAKAWTFDLDFLVQARDAGYHITEIKIPFFKRASGTAKARVLSTGSQIVWHAVKTKLAGPKVILSRTDSGFHYRGKRYVTHSNLHYTESAFKQLTRKQALVMVVTLVVLAGLLATLGHATLTAMVATLTALYFADLLYNLFLISRSFSRQIEIAINDKEFEEAEYRSWPMYTIFCPLYQEWQVLPQFVTAMSRLDYPKDRLQIMLLLEQDDEETIQHARQMQLPHYFQIVVVPDSKPKTKPKACNYGLGKALGEYSVIYDAEDVPEPNQLKKAVLAFEKSSRNTACIQAKLNFYNPRQNILTRAFTAEYSLWFDLVLTGLQSANAPIPLGGTSNHFKTRVLQQLDGWDAFNVTEDCDLGIRLAKRGYRTAIVDSVTLEEANSAPKNWFFQRTRWIKGYIQTYWVHMRDLRSFKLTLKEPHAITFQLIVGGKISSMLINPIMWAVTISYFALRPVVGPTIESFYPGPVLYMGVVCIIFGNFLYVYYYMLGCAKREQYDLIKYAYLVPIYWLAMSAAAWVALYKLIYQPHHWFKTQHGLHLANAKAMDQVMDALGQGLVDEDLVTSTPQGRERAFV
jgi:cellulose synthase/poly-beta-1,6-N-acetylglucosamine synthase-like glycosyltransferase